MALKRFVVEGKFGSELHAFSIIPEGDVKASIVIFHGMGEHKERYVGFAKWMAKQGFAVFCYDHRKHGESIGELDTVGIFTDGDRWEYVIDDAHFIVKTAREQVPTAPIVILGHSMGSIIARRYISKYSALPKAAIIMGTLPIQTNFSIFAPLMLAKIVRLFKKDKPSPYLANLLNSRLEKEEDRTIYDWLTRDEKVVDEYIEDPLCGYPYSASFYIEFFKGMVFANKSEIISETRSIPLLFISGKEDPVGGFGQGVTDVYQLYNGHGYIDLTLKLIPENRHEVLNELKKNETYKYLVEWIEKSLK